MVEAAERWEDPCPLWDDNGEAYLGRSQWGGGPIIVHRMSPDGRKLLDEESRYIPGRLQKVLSSIR